MSSFWIIAYIVFIFIFHIQFKSADANVVAQVRGKYSWNNCHNLSTDILYTIKLCEGNCEPTKIKNVKRSIIENNAFIYQLLFSFKINGRCIPATLEQRCITPKPCYFRPRAIYGYYGSTSTIYLGELNFTTGKCNDKKLLLN